jgi:hypothetical protein
MPRTTRPRLTTFAEVLDTLGGVEGAAVVTKRSKQNICNFRKRGYFAPAVYERLKKALRKRRTARASTGFDLSPELCRIEDADADAA